MCKYINVSDSKCENLLIKDTNLTNGVFRNLKIKNWNLIDSDFTSSEFFKTKLSGVDFSECIIVGISVDFDSIKGMIVNEEEALALSTLLGIKIK